MSGLMWYDTDYDERFKRTFEDGPYTFALDTLMRIRDTKSDLSYSMMQDIEKSISNMSKYVYTKDDLSKEADWKIKHLNNGRTKDGK